MLTLEGFGPLFMSAHDNSFLRLCYHFCFGAPEFSDTGHLDIVSKRQAQRDSSSHSVEKALHT